MVLVLAETAVATAEGHVIRLDSVTPSCRAEELAGKYHMDPRTVEVVLAESDEVVGGIPGFLLCMKQGTLLPNAGVDASNAPPGCIVPLPKDPECECEEDPRGDRKAVRSLHRRACDRQPDACDAAWLLGCCHRVLRDRFGDR